MANPSFLILITGRMAHLLLNSASGTRSIFSCSAPSNITVDDDTDFSEVPWDEPGERDAFVRRRKGGPYRACGPVTLERAEGTKPMSIFWKLFIPLPVRLFQEFSVLRG